MSRGRFIYFPQHILIFNVKNSWSYIQARVFSMRKSMIFDSGRVSWFFCLEFFRWGPVCLDEFFRPDVGLQTYRDPLGTNLYEKTRPERVRWQDHRVFSSRLAPLQAAQGRRGIEKTRPERAIWQERRVFSSRFVPKGSPDVRRPTSGRKNSSKRTEPHRKNSMQKNSLLGHCRILCFFAPKKLELEWTHVSFWR